MLSRAEMGLSARCGTLSFLVLAACAPTEPGPLPPGVTRSPDGAGYCCPIGTPSCDCTPTGGFTSSPAGCGLSRVCDAAPSAFVPATDAHGCRIFRVGLESCVAPLDAGFVRPDALAPPDAPFVGERD